MLNKRPVQMAIGVIVIFLFNLIIAGAVGVGYSVSAATENQTEEPYQVEFITPDSELLPEEARQAIIEAMQNWTDESPNSKTFYLVGLRWEEDWALATLTSANLGGSETPAISLNELEESKLTLNNIFALVLINTPQGWQAAYERDPHARQLVNQIPDDELSQVAKDAIFPPSAITGSGAEEVSAQQVYRNYKFPWPSGKAWVRTSGYGNPGWHGGAEFSARWAAGHALDFDIVGDANSDILAAAPGVVTYICIGTQRQTLIAVQTQGTNELLGYLHLDSNTITVEQGDVIPQHGTKLGRMRYADNQGEVSDNCGSSAGTHIHMYFPSKPFTIDGYTFSESYTYQGVNLFSSNSQQDSLATSWDFRLGLQGWIPNNSLNSPNQVAEGLWYSLQADDPYLFSPQLDLQAEDYPQIYVKMASETDACGQLYFKREGDGDFTGSQHISFNPLPDGLPHHYILDMSQNSAWVGKITQIRFDPACFRTSNNRIRLDEIAFLSSKKGWDFRNGNQSWEVISGLSAPSQTPYGLFYDVTADDPYLYSPMVNISADSHPYIYVKMSSDNDACAQVFFRRQGEPDFVGTQEVNFAPAQNVTRGYLIDMRQNPNWNGTIIQLRFDPACNRRGNHGVRIDEFAAISASTAWDFRNGPQGWEPNSSLSAPSQTPYGLFYDVTANDPYLFSPMINVLASQYSHVYIEMSSDNDACAQVFFRRQGEPDFVGTQEVNFAPEQNITRGYLIDMRQNPNWNGTVIQLRFDPACNRRGNHGVRIDKFALVSLTDATTAPVRNHYLSKTLTLNWSPITWASEYEVQVDTSDSFNNSPIVILENMTSTSISLPENGTYYWRVRAKKPDGTWGAWSAPESFVVAAP